MKQFTNSHRIILEAIKDNNGLMPEQDLITRHPEIGFAEVIEILNDLKKMRAIVKARHSMWSITNNGIRFVDDPFAIETFNRILREG